MIGSCSPGEFLASHPTRRIRAVPRDLPVRSGPDRSRPRDGTGSTATVEADDPDPGPGQAPSRRRTRVRTSTGIGEVAGSGSRDPRTARVGTTPAITLRIAGADPLVGERFFLRFRGGPQPFGANLLLSGSCNVGRRTRCGHPRFLRGRSTGGDGCRRPPLGGRGGGFDGPTVTSGRARSPGRGPVMSARQGAPARLTIAHGCDPTA